MNWYIAVLKKYATFNGRARRTEYWMFYLFNFVIAFILGIIDGVLNAVLNSNSSSAGQLGLLGGLYSLAVLIPGIAVGVRRLHDTGRSGWWMFISLIPIIGGIWLLIYLIQDGTPGPNQYGPDPKTEIAMAPGAVQPTSPPMATATPAGWFPDPTGRHQTRYWDGAAWTSHVSDNGAGSIDPV